MAIDTHCAAMKPFVQSFSPGNCEGYEQRVRSACFVGSLQPWGNRLWQAPVQRVMPTPKGTGEKGETGNHTDYTFLMVWWYLQFNTAIVQSNNCWSVLTFFADSYKGNALIAYSDVYGLVGGCVPVSVWRSCRAQIPGSPYYNPASARFEG